MFRINLELKLQFSISVSNTNCIVIVIYFTFQRSMIGNKTPTNFGTLGFILVTETLIFRLGWCYRQKDTNTDRNTSVLCFLDTLVYFPWQPSHVLQSLCWQPSFSAISLTSNTNSMKISDTYILMVLIYSVTNVASVIQITIL